MYSIYNQINKRNVLVYPERVADVTKQIDAFDLTNDQIASTYFPEDIDNVKSVTHFEKVEVGEGNFIYHGDNIDVLRSMPENSIDSVVTDPPYGLKFMKKQWDYDVPPEELWKECYRVLKPGGHLLSFGSSRTYHRMAIKVEDAGFEIRDQIMWVYGSGFPKSHNVGLSIDKLLGHPDRGHRIAVASRTHPDGTFEPNGEKLQPYETKSIEAKAFEGFGTALKPAHEPIVLAKKPISEKNIAKNVLKWNTGGINIDRCRIEFEDTKNPATNPLYRQENEYKTPKKGRESGGVVSFTSSKNKISLLGRFPANIIFDNVAGDVLNNQNNSEEKVSRYFYCPKPSKKEKEEGLDFEIDKILSRVNKGGLEKDPRWMPVVRKNDHPTVKPIVLMQYLIRLVTPIGGITLDPFFGSGTSGKSAIKEGDYKFIGIEKEKEYFNIAVERCQYEYEKSKLLAA